MCGISGQISLNNSALNYENLLNMTNELNKRGPDGEGYLISNNVDFCNSIQKKRKDAKVIFLEHTQQIGLGHRRLAITDLSSKALQPMTESDERYWIVFNGQIYNHIELRKELEKKGYKFITDHSDTEVILNSYKCWGIDCLYKLIGTWAFCLWDSLENTVFISRDRVGIRPLYYTINNNCFHFASELNALLTNKSIERELNDFAIYDYLTYTNVPAPNTIFKNIHKVPAAHYAFFKPGDAIEFKKYWSPITEKSEINLSEKEIIEQIRTRMYEATKARVPEDVKMGMLLSGGLDSSINLACLSKISSDPVKAYSVGFENDNLYKNEFEYAKKVAKHFNADLTELIITEKDFFDFIPKIAYYQDEPIADTANIPIHFISKVAQKDGIKVLFGGEGSDELFIGYQHWRLIYEFEKVFRNMPNLAGSLDYLHRKSIFKNKRPHYQTWGYKVKNNWPVFWSGTELRTEREKHKILTPGFLEKIGNYNSFMPINDLYNYLTSRNEYDTFEWMTMNDLQNRLPDQLLARLDRMTMSASIEGRHPFLDIGLIEFVYAIPSHLKVKHKTEKYLLKKAFEGVIPQEILYRPKDSFTVPLNELFQNENRKKEYIEVIRNFNKDKRIFTENYLKKITLPDNIKEFWNVLNLALWNEAHK